MALQTVPERPLSGGINTDNAGQLLQGGEFVELTNFISTARGLFRAPAYVSFLSDVTITGEPIAVAPSRASDAVTIDCLITSEEVVVLTNSPTPTVLTWDFNEGFARPSGTLVAGSGVDFVASRIKAGDLFGAGVSEPSHEISSVAPGVLTLLSDAGSAAMGEYSIRRRFISENPDLADWAIIYEDLVIATRQRELALVDITQSRIEPLVTTPTPSGRFDASCVAFFKGRVFAGDVTDELDGRVRNRLRWSSVTNPRDWSFSTAFLDFDNSTSPLMRLLPLGPVLVAYFRDAVFLGQPTGDAGLPVAFQEVETGGVGLVGQRALAEVPNGHFFVGVDNFYFLSSSGLTAIGDKVRRESIQSCREKWRVFALHDRTHSRVLFGIPGESGRGFRNIWVYDYATQSWGNEQLADLANFLAIYTPAPATIWLTAEGTWAEQGGTWADLATIATDTQLQSIIVDGSTALLRRARDDEDVTWDRTARATTRDFDLGTPDLNKGAVRFALKLEWLEAPLVPVSFTVEGSTDKGITWRELGTLTVPVGRDEGWVNFALTGSTMRFRFSTTTDTRPFYVTEYTLLLRSSGREDNIGV